MSVITKLASAKGRRDEELNIAVAVEIAKTDKHSAVKELIDHLDSKNKEIQSDCIKVLYELGEKRPKLISEYTNVFIDLLKTKNNRLVWGALAALKSITLENPETIYLSLAKILNVAEKGSVIAKDNAFYILAKLCSIERYSNDVFPLLIEQFIKSPVNQLPMYAENALAVINRNNAKTFTSTLISRLSEIEQDSKRKRIEKVIKKVYSLL